MSNKQNGCQCPAASLDSTSEEHGYRCRTCGRQWLASARDGAKLIPIPPLPARCSGCGRAVASEDDGPSCKQCGSALRFYVNEYRENRQYGGPEEGGWWFDVGTYVACHGCFATQNEADALRDELKEYVERQRRFQEPPGNVNCTGYTTLALEASEGGDFPTELPHYE